MTFNLCILLLVIINVYINYLILKRTERDIIDSYRLGHERKTPEENDK